MPLSLCFVSNLNSRKATAHMPLLWTRGLNEEGTWNPIEGSGDGSDGGIWGDSGGLIGFIGGRVEWFESLTGKNALPTYDGSGTTSNVWRAVNDDARVVDFRGTLASSGGSSDSGGGGNGGGIPENLSNSGSGSSKTDFEENLTAWDTSIDNADEILGVIWGWFSWENEKGVCLLTATFDLIAAFMCASGEEFFSEILETNVNYDAAMSALIQDAMDKCDRFINILPENFSGLLSADTDLAEIKNTLNSAAQGMTEAEWADYNAYVALCTDLPALVKNDPTNAASVTTDYLDEHLTDHATLSKGNLLALASLTVDLLSYRPAIEPK